MTGEERNTKLKHFITCLKCEVSGRECDDNCPVQYKAGNMGEIIENLEAISKALEQEPCPDAISREKTCDYIAEFINHEYSTQSECEMVEAMIDGIQHLPHVNPQYTENEIQKIQDLEQAEIEKAYELGKAEGQESDDAISRQAALGCCRNEWEEEVEIRLKSLPSVNPQPQSKTGHWIRMKAYEKWGCSECNTVFRFTFKEHDYCPNCGAKMVEPQERSDEG